ncbi:hypothetical protein AYX08_05960 [Stenotrophomonas maltophilia]|uniref:Uncharacterized protein n=2 Tax=cellular organisms TaxID=131567 RepID=A0AA39CRX5_9EURO|nr:hypothetical protein H2204_012836 [Knufia peltigerae]KYK41008.1 hypothetical protein AYX08_05960 [Stenotrophomonas maltophilia]
MAIASFHASPRGLLTSCLAYASSGLLAFGFLRETYLWVTPKLQLPLVKLLVTGASVMALAAATGISKMAVNEATGQDPTHFPTTIALLLPLSVLRVVSVVAIVVSTLSTAGLMLWAGARIFLTWGPLEEKDVLLLVARVLAGLSIALIISNTSGPAIVPSWMQALARKSALFLDLHDDPACTTKPDERTHRINDNVVIVGAASGTYPTYVRRLCAIAPE